MTEIDEVFRSQAEWQAWATTNPGVYRESVAAEIGARILTSGFIEPLTGTVIAPGDIVHSGTNWREGLMAAGLNARARAVLAVIAEQARDRPVVGLRIFATEGVTALALRLRGWFPHFLGSEYAADAAAKDALFPIPHEDLMALTLPGGRFHIVSTNEVLEHVPDIDSALREIARVLRPGGWHVGTHPFNMSSDEGDRRSVMVDGAVVHLKEPEYHSAPLHSNGSLVFETPGWNILERARAAGFAEAHMRFIASERHGILTQNSGVFVLCARK